MCKAIAHLIQSRLFYVPARIQALKTNRTRATSNFLRPFKTGNYFCGIVVCDIRLRLRRLKKVCCHDKNADIQDYAIARNFLAVSFLQLATTVVRNKRLLGQSLIES